MFSNKFTNLKVLHITHTEIRQDNRILNSMESLSRCGWDVYGVGIYNAPLKRACNNNLNVKALRLLTNTKKWRPKNIRLVLTLIEFTILIILEGRNFRPSVVHCHDTIALFVGYLLTLIMPCRLVYDAHELESDKNALTPLKSFFIRNFERIAWNQITLFITVSPSIERWYKNKYGNKPSVVVMNSPKIDDCSINTHNNLRILNNIPDDSLVFLYLGGFMKGRGIELLLEVFSNFNIKSHIVFVGYGPLQDLINGKASVCHNIHVNDAVPHNEVVQLTASADVGLCLIEKISLSDYFSLPNKLFEYAFARTPVLASDFPDINTIIQEHSLGEVCDLSLNAISKKIKHFEDLKPSRISSDLFAISCEAQALKLQNIYNTKLLYKT